MPKKSIAEAVSSVVSRSQKAIFLIMVSSRYTPTACTGMLRYRKQANILLAHTPELHRIPEERGRDSGSNTTLRYDRSNLLRKSSSNDGQNT